MRVLLLGPPRDRLVAFLEDTGAIVSTMEHAVDADCAQLEGTDWIVSYGYRHLVRDEVLARVAHRAINLHISMLPWNRGADPNLWSFLEDTPKGVTIHFMDSGLDTGDIVAQREISYSAHDSLRTTYERLTQTVETLFMETWADIHSWRAPRRAQMGKGSYHRARDKERYQDLLTQGWDTPVSAILGAAKKVAGKQADES